MKKMYDEDASNALSSASIGEIERAIILITLSPYRALFPLMFLLKKIR